MKHLKFALVLGVFIPLFALSVAGEASAQQLLNVSDRKPCKWIVVDGIGQSSPDCLNESDIKPCEALLAKALPHDGSYNKKRLDKFSGSSPLLEYALNSPPYSAPYDLEGTIFWIKKEKKIIAFLQSGDEKEMRNVIGVTFQGKALEERLAHDEKFLCMLNVRLAQLQSEARLDRKNPAGAAVKQSGNKLTGNSSSATSPTTMGATGGGHLSSQQVTTCSEEIKNKQIESQSWGGDVNDVAARLGQFQKGLFEGRCAGHPEAQAYIAGANKMLGYGGNAAGSGGSSGGSQANVEIQGSPQCAKYYIVSETQETRTSDKMFSFGIQNICNFPVYIHWNGYFNDVETQSIDYSIQLKRGTNSRPVFGPGDKIEAIPFRIANKRRFHAKIHSVCPTEAEATRLTGKRIDNVAQGARGMCIAR